MLIAVLRIFKATFAVSLINTVHTIGQPDAAAGCGHTPKAQTQHAALVLAVRNVEMIQHEGRISSCF